MKQTLRHLFLQLIFLLSTHGIDSEVVTSTCQHASMPSPFFSTNSPTVSHGLGFNGWINSATGELEGEAMSTYDRFVIFKEGEFYFVGLRSMKVYGGSVLLSRRNNNYHHLGCEGQDCPEHLQTVLMNGVRFEDGRRYSISPLNPPYLRIEGW